MKASDAHKLSVKLSPNIIIPMHYGNVGEGGSLQKFLKEEGIGSIKPEEKLSVKRGALLTKSGEIIVLKSSGD